MINYIVPLGKGFLLDPEIMEDSLISESFFAANLSHVLVHKPSEGDVYPYLEVLQAVWRYVAGCTNGLAFCGPALLTALRTQPQAAKHCRLVPHSINVPCVSSCYF
ncbi:hypothetical protein AMECASPLE_033947 [Ameca splendens]|uniref:Uncharacterized protein n=1 Tax=Ameca splendens TaxID=208324 RepID=A0ABV0ZHS0_9TELE